MTTQEIIEELVDRLIGGYASLKHRVALNEEDSDEDYEHFIVAISNDKSFLAKKSMSIEFKSDGDEIFYKFRGMEEWVDLDEDEPKHFYMCLFIDQFCG